MSSRGRGFAKLCSPSGRPYPRSRENLAGSMRRPDTKRRGRPLHIDIERSKSDPDPRAAGNVSTSPCSWGRNKEKHRDGVVCSVLAWLEEGRPCDRGRGWLHEGPWGELSSLGLRGRRSRRPWRGGWRAWAAAGARRAT